MKITLEIMGPIKRLIDGNTAEVELPEGSKILDLMKSIGYSEIEANYLVYVRGEERLRPASVLRDGDFIKAVLQVGGG